MRAIVFNRHDGYILGDFIVSNAYDVAAILKSLVGDFDGLCDIYAMGDDFPHIYDGTDQKVIDDVCKAGQYLTSVDI